MNGKIRQSANGKTVKSSLCEPALTDIQSATKVSTWLRYEKSGIGMARKKKLDNPRGERSGF